MFFAVAGFHSPVFRSKSPGAHSVTFPSPPAVLLRSDVPPHWFHSPAVTDGLAPAGVLAATFPVFAFTAADFSVGDFSSGLAPAGFASSGFTSSGFTPAVLASVV